ncbi:MAG: tannase/feruloyl esterase family alpha/beta hydrolase [Bacteroidales bacterium]|nr:tannase/feruloyl esterase family alpha/beta hydrolase [Bacteroidales bacterium]
MIIHCDTVLLPLALIGSGTSLQYIKGKSPDWDYTDYDFRGYDREIRYASAYLDATSADYSGFRDRNGKIIFWHGWNDPALSAYATIDHFNAIKEKVLTAGS